MRSGRFAPTLLFSFLIGLFAFAAEPSPAQQRGGRQQTIRAPAAAPAPLASQIPVPDQTSLAKLVWSTMAAVDHANKTGNYSVLRDLGTGGFQANNNAASLAGIFAGLRDQRIDLSDTLIIPPTYEFPPQMIRTSVLRIRGAFNMRPTPIRFDLMFEWNQGWRLEGVSVLAVGATQANQQR
jgi:hypothetical protein